MNLASKPLHVERRSKRIPRVEEGSRVFASITGRTWSTGIKVSKHGAMVADQVHRYIDDEDADLVTLQDRWSHSLALMRSLPLTVFGRRVANLGIQSWGRDLRQPA